MTARTLRQLALVTVTLMSATAFANGVTIDVPLPGTEMRLRDTSGPDGRRTYAALSDGDQSAPGPDPRITGATASIGRVGAGEVTVLDLPASGWSGGTSVRRGFKFKSQSGAGVSARIVGGSYIRISVRGDGAYPLDATPQGGVGIIVDVGGVRFCGFFGGTIVQDDGERFVARKAPAPASCSILGTTTTTTTTTTTSTTTSTTTTSTTTTSTTLGTADLSLTKTATPTTIFFTRPVSFTVTLHNDGPDTATGVVVTDLLPPSFTYVSSNPSVGNYQPGTGVWSVDTLASGDDATLGIMTSANSCQAPYAFTTQTNTAEVTAADQTDPDSTDDQAIASVFFGCN